MRPNLNLDIQPGMAEDPTLHMPEQPGEDFDFPQDDGAFEDFRWQRRFRDDMPIFDVDAGEPMDEVFEDDENDAGGLEELLIQPRQAASTPGE